MNHTLIELQVEAGIATLTLNRPEKRNAMSDAMRTEFIAALEQVAADETIRALVLTGAGKGFCAGGDIAGMERRMNAPAGEVGFNGWHRQQRVHHSHRAAAHHAQAGDRGRQRRGHRPGRRHGAGLRLHHRLRMRPASPGPTSSAGSIPDGGGMYFLPRRVGLSRAKELIFTGRKVDADEALQLGIVDRMTAAGCAAGRCAGLGAELSAGLGDRARARQDRSSTRASSCRPSRCSRRAARRRASATRRSEHRESVLAFLAKPARQEKRHERMDAIARLLKPRSVAVIGASADPTKTAGRPVAYLLKHGFAGAIYPVNPRADRDRRPDVLPRRGLAARGARCRHRAARRRARARRGARARRARHRGGHRAGERLHRDRRGRRAAPAAADGGRGPHAHPRPQHHRPGQPHRQHRAVGHRRAGDGALPGRRASAWSRRAAASSARCCRVPRRAASACRS